MPPFPAFSKIVSLSVISVHQTHITIVQSPPILTAPYLSLHWKYPELLNWNAWYPPKEVKDNAVPYDENCNPFPLTSNHLLEVSVLAPICESK